MNKSVEIFRNKDLESCGGSNVIAIASMPIPLSPLRDIYPSFPGDVEEALIHNVTVCTSEDGFPLLHFSCRTKSGRYMLFTIGFIGPDDVGFVLSEGLLGEGDKRLYPQEASRSSVGISSNYEVHLRAERGYHRLPSLILVNLRRGLVKAQDRTAYYISAAAPNSLTDGFPLMHYTTTLDFDDGIGLLVLGTGKGYLCLARFLPSWMVVAGSLLDNLPEQDSSQGELSIVSARIYIKPTY